MKLLKKAVCHLWQASAHSLRGIAAAEKTEFAFRLELLLSLAVIPLAFYVSVAGVETALLVGSWLFVLVTELLNSAIETVVDRIGTEHNTLSGRAKDLGSAAVFVACFNCVVVWLLVILF